MNIPTPILDRPEYTVGDIFRMYGDEYKASHPMSPQQRKVFRNVLRCRSSALGGHLYECGHGCGYEVPAYNSCQDRHCPMCQGIAMRKWLNGRMQDKKGAILARTQENKLVVIQDPGLVPPTSLTLVNPTSSPSQIKNPVGVNAMSIGVLKIARLIIVESSVLIGKESNAPRKYEQ